MLNSFHCFALASLCTLILFPACLTGQEIQIHNRHEIQANTFTYSSQDAPAIANYPDGSFVVAWHSRRQQNGKYGIYLQRFSAQGHPLATEQEVNLFTESTQRNPAIAIDTAGGTWVAWESFGQDNSLNAIIARRFSEDRFTGSDEILVNQFTRGNQSSVVAASTGENDVTFAWVTQNMNGDKKQIVARSFSSNGKPICDEHLVARSSRHQILPAISSSQGKAVAVWSELDKFGRPAGIYGRFLGSTTSEAAVRIDSNSQSSNIEPSVSMNRDGSFAVAWLRTAAIEYEVAVRKFDHQGQAIGQEMRASVPRAKNISGAKVEFLNKDRFLVAWNQQTDSLGKDHNISAQIFKTDGQRHGSVFPINKNQKGDHRLTPASGKRTICWDDKNQQLCVAWSGQNKRDKSAVNITALVQNGASFAFSPPDDSVASSVEDTARPHEPPIYNPKLVAKDPFGGFQSLGPEGGDFGFVAINATPLNPPDPVLAVGPTHIVAMTNGAIAFFDKQGTLTFSDQIDGAGGFWADQNATGFVFDPEALFDPHSNRFFVMANERANNRSFFLLAVSDDDNPNGNWFRYRFDVTDLSGNDIDSPNMAVDDEVVYLTADFFGPDEYLVYMLRKSDLLVGDTPSETDLLITGSQSYGLPLIYDEDAPAFYMIQAFEFGNFSTVRIHGITDALTNPQRVTTDVSVPAYGHPQDPIQMGTSVRPELFEARFWSCVYRDGSLWAVHHHSPNSSATPRARWYEFAMNDWPASGVLPELVQSGELTPTNDQGQISSTFFPSIWVDENGNAAITTARSSASEFISMSRALRSASDPANTFQDVELVQPSTSGFSAIGRWGDYSGTNSDPAEPGVFWGIHEFTQSDSIWQTFIAKYEVENAAEFVFPSAFNTENGTTISGGIVEVLESDDSYLSVLADVPADTDGEEVVVAFTANTVNTTFNSLTFNIESSVNTPNVVQNVELFNFTSLTFELVDSQSAELVDTSVAIEVTGDVSRFVTPGSGLLRARVSFESAGATLFFPWQVNVDRIDWQISN